MGCGLAAAVVVGVLLVLGSLALVAGLFLVRGTSESVVMGEDGRVQPAREYSAGFGGIDGSTMELWAAPSANCIGVTIDEEEAAACRDAGPVIDELIVAGQRWAVMLAEVGVALEPVDDNCLQSHDDTVADHNVSWCRLP